VTTSPGRENRGEWIADICVHAVGLAAGAIGAAVMIVVSVLRHDFLVEIGVALYAAGLLAMLGCSTIYNGIRLSQRRELLRRLDHAAIFSMIAGTYTPLLLTKLGGAWGAGLLTFVWLVAIAGMIVKLLSPNRFTGLSIALYLALGWSGLIAINQLLASLSLPAIVLIIAGGCLYSIGVLFHLWERLPYQKAIWHGFVIAAAACHYIAICHDVVFNDVS
jgi:hemolysin III